MKKLLLLMLVILPGLCVWAQRQVSGRVTDARDNSPIPGASVNVKGTNTGTTTDENGEYRVSAPVNAVLVFSVVGFSSKEIPVTESDVIIINTSLEIASGNLQEVVVTGYTTQNKRQVTGSVARVSGNEIRLQPVGSFDKALQGKVAGVLAQSQTGQPGAAAVVTIRGKGSINGSNTPLYIVDGVQVNAADFATINPSDIESYNILKDASSTAIYGSRGANGVIVITTKRGAIGKTRINYDFQYGFSELPESKLGLMNSAQKLDYEVNYDRPDYGMNFFGWSPAEIDSLSKIDNQLDKILFRKGKTQQHQLSASGGNDKTRFYLSGSLFDQEGIVLTTGLKRYTGRANIENTFGNFKVGLNTTLGYSRVTGTRENDQYIGSPLNAINWYNPYIGLYDANGVYQDDYLQGQPNPLRELLENTGHADQIKGVGSAYIEFNVPWVQGLKLRTLWGADFTNDEGFGYLDRSTDQGGQSTGSNGQVGRNYAKTFRYTGTTSLGYQRSIGDHEISAAIFNEIIKSKTNSFGFTGFGLVGPFRNEAGITPGSPTNGYIPTVAGDATANALLSYFVDANYGFRRKYYVSAGARRDGSSRFGANRQWANFGQVGLSWIVSEEGFLQRSSDWLSELKVKASYGTVGNQIGIGNFAARELLAPTVYNGIGGLLLNNLANPDLRWEKKTMFNAGVEFTLWQGRVGGTVEYYNNVTNDLFLDRQLSRTSGFASLNTNLGKLQNRGIEASINVDVFRTNDFNWSLGGNYTYNRNKILEQPGQPENISGLFINKEGEQANSLYVVRYAGVNATTGSAEYFKLDGKTRTDIYDPSDAVIIGTIDPPHFGGVTTTIGYKGIELDVLVSYAFGNYIYNNDRVNVENPAYWYSRLTAAMLREWQQPGDITDVPSPFNDFHPETTRFVEKGDYIRLRNVMLSYSLPQSILGNWKINTLRVFAQGQNLHVWHSFKGWDPEVTTGILGGAQYPQLKTITFGLNVGL